MSYCRKGHDSDVYVYEHVDSKWVCCMCALQDPDTDDFYTQTIPEMLDHLAHHVVQGHKVPDQAIERLAREQDYLESGWWRRRQIKRFELLEFKLNYGKPWKYRFDSFCQDLRDKDMRELCFGYYEADSGCCECRWVKACITRTKEKTGKTAE